MAVLPADLIYPTGEVRTDWFPGEDVPAALALWLAEGVATAPEDATEAQVDAVAEPWGYHRAFTAKADLIAASPSSAAISGALSVGNQKDRHEYFANRAAFYLGQYEAALAAAAPAEPAAFAGYAVPTHAVERTVAW